MANRDKIIRGALFRHHFVRMAIFFLACFAGPTAAAQDDAPRCTIFLKGQKKVGESDLRQSAKEELNELEEDCSKISADDAAFQMESILRHLGYPFSIVDYAFEESEKKIVVTFVIQEGPRAFIRTLAVEGNSSYPNESLLPFFKSEGIEALLGGNAPYVESDILGGAAEVRNFYYGQGFLDVAVSEPEVVFSEDRTAVDITVTISEGVHYKVASVEMSGDIKEDLAGQVADIKTDLLGKPFFPRRKLNLRQRLEGVYADEGYPDVNITVMEERNNVTGDVALETVVQSGPRIRIGDIRVTEEGRETREAFIRNRLSLREGDYFSQEKKRESFRSLYATGLFSRVSLDLTPDGRESERDLLVAVEEKPSREVFVQPGWGSYELFRMGFGFKEKNLFGTGRIVNLEGLGTMKGEKFQVSFMDPWFLDTDITADIPLFYRRREDPGFTRQEIGTSLLFTKKLTTSLSLTAGYLYRSTDLFSVDNFEEAPETTYNIGSLSGKLIQDTRSDIFFPSSGYRASFSVELADRFLGGDLNFYRFTAGYRVFRKIKSEVILGFRYDTGIIMPAEDQNTIPLSERFFNGGENTVRSFKESMLGPRDSVGDPAGGLAYNVFSVEARKRLTENLGASLFFDWGNVSPNRTRSEEGGTGPRGRDELVDTTLSQYLQDFQPGLGVGLQYILPVGPARLDLALNPDRQEERGDEELILHFSLGMAF